MKMGFVTLSVWLWFVLHSPSHTKAFRWTGTTQDGDKLENCEAQLVTIPWMVGLDDEERVEHSDYYRLLAHGSENTNSSQVHPDGEKIPPTDSHYSIGPGYHLNIHGVTRNDSGFYTLTLRVMKGTKTQIYRSKVTLTVLAAPRIDGIRLRLNVEPKAVSYYNGTNSNFRVTLSCGFFLDLGQPPVTVDYRFPSGTVVHGSFYRNGHFMLMLPNPAQVGKYTCKVNPDSPTLKCAGTNETARSIATTDLTREYRQVIILGAENERLQSTVSRLQSNIRELRSAVSQLFINVGQLQSAVKPQNLTAKTSKTCHSIRAEQYTLESGVWTLNINSDNVSVYCDQRTDGGGWTVIQRRENGRTNFYRDWDDYVQGFGDPSSEYWLGLERIHLLSKNRAHELRVDLWAFDGKSAFAVYGHFSIEGGRDNYRLRVSHFDESSTAGNSLAYHNSWPFTTRDKDNDGYSGNCGVVDHGGWWYNWCAHANLNGIYKPSAQPGQNGTVWWHWRSFMSLKKVEMKIRPL